jgi:hypothetical protein
LKTRTPGCVVSVTCRRFEIDVAGCVELFAEAHNQVCGRDIGVEGDLQIAVGVFAEIGKINVAAPFKMHRLHRSDFQLGRLESHGGQRYKESRNQRRHSQSGESEV